MKHRTKLKMQLVKLVDRNARVAHFWIFRSLLPTTYRRTTIEGSMERLGKGRTPWLKKRMWLRLNFLRKMQLKSEEFVKDHICIISGTFRLTNKLLIIKSWLVYFWNCAQTKLLKAVLHKLVLEIWVVTKFFRGTKKHHYCQHSWLCSTACRHSSLTTNLILFANALVKKRAIMLLVKVQS